MRKTLYLLVLLAIGLIQSSFSQGTAMTVSDSRSYMLGPGDQILVKVLGEKDFDFESAVDEKGNIEVPFFDKSIPAMCRSARELRMDVTKLLSKYLKSPQVSLKVTERNTSRDAVMIFGAVNKQQEVILGRQFRLSELIAASGGTTEDAGGTIQLIRNRPPMCADADTVKEWNTRLADTNQVPSAMYSLSSLRTGNFDSNPIIYPGDIIEVEKAKPVYVIGEVMAPQGIYLKEDGLTVREAIYKIGGISRDVKVKEVKILRLKAGSKDREEILVNWEQLSKNQGVDPVLEPYDYVIVNKTKKSIAQTILDIAINGGRSAFQTLSSNASYKILY